MLRRILWILILSVLITSCGGAAPATQAPAATQAPTSIEVPTEAPATEAPGATEPFFGGVNTNTPEPPTTTPSPALTRTPAATFTDTPLPTLELPTAAVNAPATAVWDGVPTYLGDSTPGFDFRVTYDPDLWAVTTDQFGFASLAHRNIPNCVISVTSGRGLPPSITVEHDVLRTNTVTFYVGTAFENGVKKFVTFTGGDSNIITAFEVSFTEQSDTCLADAVKVLSTLRSIPASRATPTLTP
ncbi:MAG TPA: hypothetical protein VK909_05820 [Anaerolineales bacterium]|nr:hypothetical protein [Anaerolineales bacterium]